MTYISLEEAHVKVKSARSSGSVWRYMAKVADALLIIEPIWIIPILVYCYFLTASVVPGSSSLVWVGLSIACVPFVLRKLRWGYFSIRSVFEIPAAIFLAGAIIGVAFSIDLDLSIRTLQSLLACLLLYYSAVNYRRPGVLMIFFGILFIALIVIYPSLVYLQMKSSSLDQTVFTSWIIKLVDRLPAITVPSFLSESIQEGYAGYAIAFPVVMLLAVLVGVMLFSRNTGFRVTSFVIGVLLFIVIALLSVGGIERLINGTTIESRLTLWQDTLYMLRQNPITGLGLGMPLLFTYGYFQSNFQHPHNAFLELYSNTGILGMIAMVVTLVVGIKCAIDILRGNHSSAWYGVGVGLMIAVLVAAGLSMTVTTMSGHLVKHDDGYYYLMSAAPWILGAGLVMCRQIVRRKKE